MISTNNFALIYFCTEKKNYTSIKFALRNPSLRLAQFPRLEYRQDLESHFQPFVMSLSEYENIPR